MNRVSPSRFSTEQTHRFVELDSFSVSKTSADLDWAAAYISVQSETPYAASFEARPDILIASNDSGSVLADITILGHQQTVLRPSGSVTVMPDCMAFDVDLHAPIDTTHLYLRRSILDEVAGGLYRGDPVDIDLRFRMAVLDPVLGVVCHAVRKALDEDPKISSLYVEHLMRAVAAYLIKRHSDADKKSKLPPLKAALTAHQLSKVREMIESRFAERLTLLDFSTEFGMSADHFGRLFKLATGVPVHQFLLRCRIDRARRFLAETTMPIANIALECGFTDQMRLTRSFRRIVGTTPAAFRRDSQSVLSR